MRDAYRGTRTPFAIELEDVGKVHRAVGAARGGGSRHVHALRGVSAAVRAGEFVAVMGPSGSGKSSFLQCAAGLDHPTSGTVRLGGVDLAGLSEARLTELRRDRVGFVFQAFNLIPSLSVYQNITLPCRLAGRRVDQAWLREITARVGLGDRLRHRPAQLSGGQQQRVAIARALLTRPAVVFADEPTGALDTAAAAQVLALLRMPVDEVGAAVVMVTHDAVAASRADTVLFLAGGELVDRLDRPDPAQVAERMARLRTPVAA